MSKFFSQYRRRLANYESVLSYSLLGLIGGMASGLVVLAFEISIAELASLWGVGNDGEDFESLPRWMQFALPTCGALILGLVYSLLKTENRETGIVHVLSRMHSHYGALPARNAIIQFVGGAFALASGQSGGREGPGVHLGGAVNSWLGQRLGLPNNSLRVLIACGTAGGISAAFNTPLAGVIFAMEVIIAEYTVVGFIPVMLAAISASAINQGFSGDTAFISIPHITLNSLWEVPYIILLGFVCGSAVAAFIHISKLAASQSHRSVILRFTAAGLITGTMALLVPQILGIGYDTLYLLVNGEVTVTALIIIATAKLVATAVSTGVGMPIGLIGPNLVIGGCIGGIAGTLGTALYPELSSSMTLYVVLGMGASMAAVLNAPLAAVLAVIEMTHTVSIGMPALLAIVTATLTNSSLYGNRSAHRTALSMLQRTVPNDPVTQLLHRTAATSIMDVRAMRVPTLLEQADLEPLLEFTPEWCLLSRSGEDLYLVQGRELLDWLGTREHSDEATDLTEADIRRWTMTSIPLQATLRQTIDAMRMNTVETACVFERSSNSGKRILHGVVTRDGIEKFSLSNMF